MQEAILGQFPTLDLCDYPVVTSSSEGESYHPGQWPSTGFGSAPSLSTVQAWMAQ